MSTDEPQKPERKQDPVPVEPAAKATQGNEPQRTAASQTPAKTAAKPAKAADRSRAPVLLAGIALIVALAALGGAAWLYQENAKLTGRLNDVDRSAQTRFEELASHDAIKKLDERTRLLAERVAARFAKIDESLQRTDETLRSAAEEQIRDQRGWRLAEIDYVLRIAAHRLMLLQDIDGAIAALQTADRQLHQLGSPVFIPLRERLDADMRALRTVQRPDIPGVAIRIDGLMDVVYELPPRSVPSGFQTAGVDSEAGFDGV
ncbi:MAG: uroporphyrinogen-III C-methyltransferase, partial [Gammaproteobacteria bacterium]|nr:uroporphyrinogen-III C-methyltransferase [Gammaproteobacteria bacterium]